MNEFADTVDRRDVDRFAAQSADWWNPSGSFRPLHQLNPVRIEFIRRELLARFGRDPRALSPFTGLSLADIGCGGGLVSEPMRRLGFTVTGIDAGSETIASASAHAVSSGLAIDYRVGDVAALARTGERFDVVLALEIVEHVVDRAAFLAALGALVKPHGVLIGATLNRTARAFALVIAGAEYVLGWLPRGTHDWRRFVRPSQFAAGLRPAGLVTETLVGLSYDLPTGEWRRSDDLSVNYMLVAVRR
jgi:2-polyprenyl-6-hydroxyphenyl methylase / 3-demethylubiquinone-9 3-methyltransferase